jgi:DNA invertase Pin-like site-specific DNA recombinase
VLDQFAHGVWFVNLAPISDPNLVAATIAQLLGLRALDGQPYQEGLKRHLREQHTLLVLDNVEQVVQIASATEPIERATASGRATFGMLAVMAQLQSDQLSEKMRDTRLAEARQGRLAGPVRSATSGGMASLSQHHRRRRYDSHSKCSAPATMGQRKSRGRSTRPAT